MGKNGLITYKGKEIYYMDFSKLNSTKKVTKVINVSKDYIRNQEPYSLLALTNITNMHFNGEIRDLFTNFVNENKPYIKASAVIGVSGLQGIVYNAVMKISRRNVKLFKTADDAKDWLIEQF